MMERTFAIQEYERQVLQTRREVDSLRERIDGITDETERYEREVRTTRQVNSELSRDRDQLRADYMVRGKIIKHDETKNKILEIVFVESDCQRGGEEARARQCSAGTRRDEEHPCCHNEAHCRRAHESLRHTCNAV